MLPSNVMFLDRSALARFKEQKKLSTVTEIPDPLIQAFRQLKNDKLAERSGIAPCFISPSIHRDVPAILDSCKSQEAFLNNIDKYLLSGVHTDPKKVKMTIRVVFLCFLGYYHDS